MNTAGSLFSQQIGLSTWKNYDMVIRRLICKRDEEFRWIFPDDIFEGGGAVDPPIFACKFAHVKDCSRRRMAYTCPKSLDGFVPHLPKADIQFRLQVGLDLLGYLAEGSNSTTCHDIGQLLDGLILWMQSSNDKVSSNGIEAMTLLIDRPGHDFRPYLGMILPEAMDRLGNAKGIVRKNAQLLILKLLEHKVLNPQTLLDKLTPGFTHKNANMREEVLRCLVNTVNKHRAAVQLRKFIPKITKLLSDPVATVRDTAFTTLVNLYKHVGEKLQIDLQKRHLVPSTQLPALLNKFEEAKCAGELLPAATAIDAPSTSSNHSDSETSSSEKSFDSKQECSDVTWCMHAYLAIHVQSIKTQERRALPAAWANA